jgi:hypothetical protein
MELYAVSAMRGNDLGPIDGTGFMRFRKFHGGGALCGATQEGTRSQRGLHVLIKCLAVQNIAGGVGSLPDGDASKVGPAVESIRQIGGLGDGNVVPGRGGARRPGEADEELGIPAGPVREPGRPRVVREPGVVEDAASDVVGVGVGPGARGALRRVVELDEDHVERGGGDHLVLVGVRDDALRRRREVVRGPGLGEEQPQLGHQGLVPGRVVDRRVLDVQVEAVDREAGGLVVERPREPVLDRRLPGRPEHAPEQQGEVRPVRRARELV